MAGLRGPLPTPPHLRSVRNARRRPRARGLQDDVERVLRVRAEELNRLALRLLKRAERKPTMRTPSNGEQASPLFAAAHKLFEAADRIYLRLGRLAPEADAPGGPGANTDDELEAFRRATH